MKTDSQTILEATNLNMQFGGFIAVSELSFSLKSGEIVGLVGPNGAGKTTVFNMISGFLTPTRGKVKFRDEDITDWQPSEIARKGVVRTFQLNKLFATLSVEQNVLIGCHKHEKGGIGRFLFWNNTADREELQKEANRIIEMVGLGKMKNQKAQDLAYGDQKLLGIGIALGANPTVLMLDEPFAGMNQTEASRCVSLVRRIQDLGTTMFLVDHNMRAIMGICDRVIVLNFGQKIAEGSPEEIQTNPDVATCYLGSKKNC